MSVRKIRFEGEASRTMNRMGGDVSSSLLQINPDRVKLKKARIVKREHVFDAQHLAMVIIPTYIIEGDKGPIGLTSRGTHIH